MANYLCDYLNDGEERVPYAQVFRTPHNMGVHGDPCDLEYVNLSEVGATMTLYAGDTLKLCFGAIYTDEFISRGHAGMKTNASLEITGICNSDICQIN